MNYQKIIVEKKEKVTYISMNSPENLNAFDELILQEMTDALDNCESDENCKVIVIKGLGKGFSAGGDIQGMKKYLEKDINDFFRPVLKNITILALRIRDIGKPVIASVHGAAAGAGFNLALCCDFIVSSEKAKYVQAFVNIGLIPDMGGTYFLSKALNPSKTMEFAMLGDVISAKKLYELGVINILAEDDELAEETDKLALKLSSKPSESLRKTKELVNKINYPELSEFLDIEYEYQIQLANEKDFAEGINAFLEKRKPQFS
ncbi:MAG: enoyl-CoA hydratase-related protein [Eubacteriales bacterium]|nr:enoyl-CoA hydratase-related protein [Eubacteriales bacterium]NCC81588.1 enoyl-CoA hydratase [Clostridia bacterium]